MDILQKTKKILNTEDFSIISSIFNSLNSKESSQSFIQFHNERNSFLLNRQKWKRKICMCNQQEICIVDNIFKLKECKNFENFCSNNPTIQVMFGNHIKISPFPIFTPKKNILEIKTNISNLIILINNFQNNEQYMLVLSLLYYSMHNFFVLICDKDIANTINDIFDLFLSDLYFLSLLRQFDQTKNIGIFKEFLLIAKN